MLNVEQMADAERGNPVLNQALGRLRKGLLNLSSADHSNARFLEAAQHKHGGRVPTLARATTTVHALVA